MSDDRCSDCTWDGDVVAQACAACEESCRKMIEFLTRHATRVELTPKDRAIFDEHKRALAAGEIEMVERSRHGRVSVRYPVRKKRPYAGPPIAWKTCPHCSKDYDEGNPFASFQHRNRECMATPRQSESQGEP